MNQPMFFLKIMQSWILHINLFPPLKEKGKKKAWFCIIFSQNCCSFLFQNCTQAPIKFHNLIHFIEVWYPCVRKLFPKLLIKNISISYVKVQQTEGNVAVLHLHCCTLFWLLTPKPPFYKNNCVMSMMLWFCNSIVVVIICIDNIFCFVTRPLNKQF